MGGGGRPRWGGAGKGASLFWNFSPCPPPLSSPLQLPAPPLIGNHRRFIPTERFYDGNHFQVEKGDENHVHGFLKALGEKTSLGSFWKEGENTQGKRE